MVDGSTFIARLDPALAGVISTSPTSGPARNPYNRSVRIPVTAVDLGNGKSGFMPPGESGFYFVLSNTDASIFQKCTSNTLTAADYESKKNTTACESVPGYFISGDISFDLGTRLDLVTNGGARPADPPNTACDFYSDAQTAGLITTGGALSASAVWVPSKTAANTPIYANVVTGTGSPATGNYAPPPTITVALSSNTLTGPSFKFNTGATVTLATGGVSVLQFSTLNGSGSTLSAANGSTAIINGASMSISFASSFNLLPATTYTLTISANGIEAKRGSSTDTNSSAIVHTFTTSAAAPQLTSVNPASGSTVATLSPSFTFTFDQGMTFATPVGTIELAIKQGNSWSPVASVAADGVGYSGNNVTVQFAGELTPNKDYRIVIPANTLKGAGTTGTPYAGNSTTPYLFSTPNRNQVATCPTSTTVQNYLDQQIAGFTASKTTNTPTCYSNANAAAIDGASRYVSFFCVITMSGASSTTTTAGFSWNGRLNLLGPTGWLSGANSRYKVCRFTNPNNDATVTNDEHPESYSGVDRSLTDQNFYIINKARSCPSQTLTLGNPGDQVTVYYNTVQHQPTP